MGSATEWSTAVAAVREQIAVQRPTQDELVELAVVLLEEVWVAVKAGNARVGGPVGDALAGSQIGSTVVGFKRVLEAAHDMRLQTPPPTTPI
jgi:hypothetical protein